MAGLCRACGARIRWIRTVGGRMMPCEEAPRLYWESRQGRERIVTPNGQVLACALSGEAEQATGLGFLPHWAACPGAGQLRTKAAVKRPGVDPEAADKLAGLREQLMEAEHRARMDRLAALRADLDRMNA